MKKLISSKTDINSILTSHKTYGQKIKSLNNEISEFNIQIAGLELQIKSSLEKHFFKNNGCKRCLGRGWIVVWDTMDSMSRCYAEYGKCDNPECTEESRKISGFHPSYSQYDEIRGMTNPFTKSLEYQTIVEPLRQRLYSLNIEIEDLNYEFKKKLTTYGTEVIVVKGRKVPIGTIGRIEYYNAGYYGPYIKIQTAKGEQYSISIDNVDVLISE